MTNASGTSLIEIWKFILNFSVAVAVHGTAAQFIRRDDFSVAGSPSSGGTALRAAMANADANSVFGTVITVLE